MQVTLRPLGRSRGVIIPSRLLRRVGLRDKAQIEVQNGALVLRPTQVLARQGWKAAAQAIATAQDLAEELGDQALADEGEWQW